MFSVYHRFPIIVHDICIVAIAWALAFLIRYDWPLANDIEIIFWHTSPIVVLSQSFILWYSGLYRGIWRFTSLPDLATIFRAVILGTLAIVLMLTLFNRLEGIPRSTLLLYPLLLIFLLGTPRMLYRVWNERSLLLTTKVNQHVLVLGAGSSGDMLVRDMLRNPNSGYIPVGFLDDNPRLHGGKVQGVVVLDDTRKTFEMVETLKVDLIVIAMPSASDEQMQQVVDLCEKCHIPFRTLPKLDDIVNRQVNINALRDVSIDDLLGRAKVQLDWQIISEGLTEKVVMVTGGGGSIGSELCRQIARLQPIALIIFERCEFNLYQIELKLKQEFPTLKLYACLGDITDEIAVQHILQQYQPQVVFHAAAYKHVPMLQFQTREAVRNNILGTKILVKNAVQYHCQTFIMISTDKAVNPSNVMGTTKRVAELHCQAMNQQSNTKFITVRFGNVLGSAGSVVPLFKKQIAQGGPVTVTHPDINRYFMTIPEACQLILQAAVMGCGGEIFVLDMGKPIRIKYLAEQMIKLSGKTPEKEIEIIYTGLRPGEKLHEELFHKDEKLKQTQHAKILLAEHRPYDEQDLDKGLIQLSQQCDSYSETMLQQTLKQLVPEMEYNR